MDTSEISRVKAVHDLQIIGSPAEPEFDRFARLAGHVAHADYAHVCFIDEANQFVKARAGLTIPQILPANESICIDVVASKGPVLIENLAVDPRPKCQNVYSRFRLASYVGVPIRWSDDAVVGVVAALSFESGLLSRRRVAALQECADLVSRELLIRKAASDEVRRSPSPVTRQSAATPDLIRAITRNHLEVLKSVSDGVIVVRGDGVINFVNPAAEQILSRSATSMLGSTFAKKLNVSETGAALPGQDCPVAASLRDGNDRLAKRAYFLGATWEAVKVEYAVTPIKTVAQTIGAVIIFRRIVGSSVSNGVDLRNTLREVYRLKHQIARLEGAQEEENALASTDLPDLGTGQPLDFQTLLQTIREEQAGRMMRVQAPSKSGVHGLAGPGAPVGTRLDLLGRNASSEAQNKAQSRIDRWREF